LRKIRLDHEKGRAASLRRHGIDATFDPVRREARIDAIPEGLVRQFSKRTQIAETDARKYLADRGIDFDAMSPQRKSRHMTIAAAITRTPEHKAAPNVHAWQRQSRDLGFRLSSVLSVPFRIAQRLAVSQHHEQVYSRSRHLGLDEDEYPEMSAPTLRL
jgi:hypothetical protein